LARSSITGDTGKLAAWAKLAEAAPELLGAISESGAEELLNLVADGFRSETDPYGQGWQPKKRPDGRKTLSGKTSRLKKFAKKRVDKNGFTIGPTVDYAAPHQNPKRGTRPRRMMVPSKSRGLPRAWSKTLEELATEAMRQHFSTGGGSAAGGGGMGFLTAKVAGIKRQLNIKSLIRKLANAASDE
jgi:phage gpG-like protein